MVGVPGRSQSCLQCITRRKGCGRQRPACAQCLQAGFTCPGYSRNTIFVNRTQAIGPSSVSYSKKTLSDSIDSDQDVTLPTSLAQTAYTLRYVDSFWSAYLPCGKAFTTEATRLTHGGWTNIVIDLYPADKSLQYAMQAVALRHLGEQQCDEVLLNQGFIAYSKCLQELHRALKDSRRLNNDGILCTAKLLSIFEMHYGDTDHGVRYKSWIAHANGQEAILHARKPQEFRSGKSHHLFSAYRYGLVVSALLDRRSFPFNKNGWKTIPWKSYPKTPLDKLLDILASLATMLEAIDAMNSCDDQGKKKMMKEQIERYGGSIDKQLQSWVNEAEPLMDFESKYQGNDVLGPDNSEEFGLAHLTILYWAACALLCASLHPIGGMNPDRSSRMDLSTTLSSICTALPFFMSPKAGMMGLTVVSFPLGVVIQAAAGMGGHKARKPNLPDGVKQFFQSPSKTRGIAGFLRSFDAGLGRHDL